MKEISTIEKLRKHYRLTQKQFADQLSIPYRTIQNWEEGKRKCPEYVERLIIFYFKNMWRE